MRIIRDKQYAVLTGDIVGSSRLSAEDRRRLPEAMKKAGRDVKRAHANVVPVSVELFRGDGWQLIVTQPGKALAVALAYRAALRMHISGKVDSRVAIGIGTLTFLPGNKISEGDGEALQRAGRGLAGMDRRVRLLINAADSTATAMLNALIWLIDAHAQSWTASQSQAIAGALCDWTQETIAKRWTPRAISQQAVAQHLDRAAWYAVEKGLLAFEEWMTC